MPLIGERRRVYKASIHFPFSLSLIFCPDLVENMALAWHSVCVCMNMNVCVCVCTHADCVTWLWLHSPLKWGNTQPLQHIIKHAKYYSEASTTKYTQKKKNNTLTKPMFISTLKFQPNSDPTAASLHVRVVVMSTDTHWRWSFRLWSTNLYEKLMLRITWSPGKHNMKQISVFTTFSLQSWAEN